MNIDPTSLNLPPWTLEAVLIWLALLGLILWLLGIKLVRPVIGLIGMAGGAALTTAFVQQRFPETVVWPWMIAGAAMFGIIGWIMWRLLVAVMLGGTVALLMLTAVMLWSDIPPPPIWPDVDAQRLQAEAIERQETGEDESVEQRGVRAFIRTLATNITEAWRGWWNALEDTHQLMLTGGALAAGTLALLVGLALPRISSSLITALLGVLLMTPGLGRWLPMLHESMTAWMPRDGRQYMVLLVAATLIGAFLQWAFFRKSADK